VCPDSDAEDPLPKKRPGWKRKKEAVVFVDDSGLYCPETN